MGLESLSPARKTQYDSLIPEIERSVRNAQNARGGFYSGEAVDAEARAKADLLRSSRPRMPPSRPLPARTRATAR